MPIAHLKRSAVLRNAIRALSDIFLPTRIVMHEAVGRIVPQSKEWGSPRNTIAKLADAVDDCNASHAGDPKQSLKVVHHGICTNLKYSAPDEVVSGEFLLPSQEVVSSHSSSQTDRIQHSEYVADLRRVRLFNENECGMLILPSDTVVIECSHWAAERDIKHGSLAHRHLRLPKPSYIAGKSLYLPRGTSNYYHFLMDTLAQIGLVQDTHPVASFDHFVMPTVNTAFGKQILFDRLSIREEQIVWASHHHWEFEQLIVPTVFNRAGNWYISYLRKLFEVEHTEPPTKRLYVTRRGASVRRVSNEEEVSRLLTTEFGFTVLQSETLSMREQISHFVGAQAVVGVHGAGLTNIAFCSPNTIVCELRHEKHWGTASGCFQALSEDAGLRYASLLCSEQSSQPDVLVKSRDITVDIDELRLLLKQYLD